jgi:glycosyltransferase involved in cell wall biosynthesis
MDSRWLMDILLFGIIAFTCSYQAYYLLESFFVRVGGAASQSVPPGGESGSISVLIPVFNSSQTIGACLASLLANDLRSIANVVIALDHSTDASAEVVHSFDERFRSAGVDLTVVELGPSKFGKVAGILDGGRYLRSHTALLLDADIILEPNAIRELLDFHIAGKHVFSSCLIFPYDDKRNSTLVKHLICNNRIYRQALLQAVKNRHGVANFPGGVQLVDFHKYRALLEDGFLEDLVATYRVLATGGRIAILPRVLAYEVERQTISGLLRQRVRWTIGAIQNVRAQMRTSKTRSRLDQKMLISSFHVMWELQHYVNTLGVLMALVQPYYAAVFLAPAALYALQIARSAHLGRGIYRNSISGIVAHCVFYPAILTAALIGAAGMLAKSRRFYFKTQTLFSRD